MNEADTICADLKAVLIERHFASVMLDCQDVTLADLSFVQLLLSARMTGKANGTTVSLSAPAQGALADSLTRAGLSRPDDSGQGWFDSFWAGGP